MNPQVLRVQGKGKVSAEPDEVVLSFRVARQNSDYTAALNSLNEHVETLRCDLGKVNIPRHDLKTTDFEIKTKTRHSLGRDVFDCYVAAHDLKLSLPLNQERLNQVLKTVTQSGSEARLRISFGVKDEAPLRKRLLEAAVANAKQNAQVLSTAAGVKLGQILSVEYGAVEVRVHSAMAYELAPSDLAAPDITPQEIRAEDSVTIVWQIAS